jgi:hypothetical protein
MSLDTANRSFAAMLGIALVAGMLVLCGAIGCVLVAIVVSRIAQDGVGALTADGRDLWPAVAFIALVGTGVAVALRSAVGQVRDSQRLAGRVAGLALPLPGELVVAAQRAGLAGRVSLVDSPERFSFAYGALTPRVALSAGLIEATSPDELDAILAHERYHVRNLDPFKVVLARTLPALFFYLPLFRALQARYVAGRELAADRKAAESCGRKPLAGALLKVVRGPAWPELRTAAAIGGPELLDARVAQLETGTEPQVASIGRRALCGTLAGALAMTGLFVASVAGFGGPSEVANATGAGLTPLDIAGAFLCAAPWAAGIWLGFRWLGRRTRRPLDTIQS